ncbi:response regulator transcription factor [Crenobacter intestini]|uniref:Response regulator transcription factor n=1 Tax=Crenobacter intestini TaxID=2563443 RepID=A0A4T0V5Z0_9NEIS|nr:response regulator [Crenobacter intestini]TIC87092.1 response regulator transcription factor [Crenobacter intestini]
MSDHLATAVVHLIDDDAAVRAALELLLASQGYTVHSHESGDAFLALPDPGEIGAIILDIRMPGLSGLALQEMLAERAAKLPIIFITGHGDVEQCARAFRGGAIDFLPKPVNRAQLIDSLRRAFRLSISRQARDVAIKDASERLARLSEREHDILERVVDGCSSKEIARELDLSPRTVEAHRASLFAKLEVGSLAELIRLYLSADRVASATPMP